MIKRIEGAIKISKYTIMALMVVSLIWIIAKKSNSKNMADKDQGTVSGFNKMMIGFTGIIERLTPASPLTRHLKEEKQKLFNQF